MSTETLALVGALAGVTGALTGMVSLAWQFTIHRRSGRLVTVECSYAIPVYGSADAPEFHEDDQVAITVTNYGGAPVTVTNYGVSVGGKGAKDNLFVMSPTNWATKLPASVEPGGQPARLLVPVKDLRRVQDERGISFRDMRPWVDLGDGRRVYSKAVPVE